MVDARKVDGSYMRERICKCTAQTHTHTYALAYSRIQLPSSHTHIDRDPYDGVCTYAMAPYAFKGKWQWQKHRICGTTEPRGKSTIWNDIPAVNIAHEHSHSLAHNPSSVSTNIHCFGNINFKETVANFQNGINFCFEASVLWFSCVHMHMMSKMMHILFQHQAS